jgi:ABC-2 type transport system permease protein
MYFKLIGISFQGRMQFRADFFTGLVGVLVLNAFTLAMIGVILGRFQNLNGWTLWEIVFLFGLWSTAHSIYSMLFWHVPDLENFIIDGTFDRFMVRPISPFLQFIGHEINYVGFGDVVVGVTTLALSISHLNLNWSGWHWPFLILVILSGALIEFSIQVSLCSVAFWTGRSASIVFTVNRFSWLVQQYPVDMFGRWFRIFVTSFVPVAFMNYYPALVLLGRVSPGQPWAWLSFISPLVGLALLGVASLIWRTGIRRYSSTGS